jgi:excisionase family DNA binding protein
MVMANGQQLLTTEEVLEQYPISQSTLNRLVRDGRLRFYRLAGTRRNFYAKAELDALWVVS